MKLTYNSNVSWMEIKCNHSDNLASTRVFWNGPEKKWDVSLGKTGMNPIKQKMMEVLNEGEGKEQADDFLEKICQLTGKQKYQLIIPTNKSQLKSEYSVTFDQLKEYHQTYENQYFVKIDKVDIGPIISEQYSFGKAAPVGYLQVADDFYALADCFSLKKRYNIPDFESVGSFNFRFLFRETKRWIELIPELKSKEYTPSPFSCLNYKEKINPFDCLNQ